MKKCGQKTCTQRADHFYFWPGKMGARFICHSHSLKLMEFCKQHKVNVSLQGPVVKTTVIYSKKIHSEIIKKGRYPKDSYDVVFWTSYVTSRDIKLTMCNAVTTLTPHWCEFHHWAIKESECVLKTCVVTHALEETIL